MVARLSRQEFLDEYFDWRPGEHISLIEPTRGGKTYLAGQLMDGIIHDNPDLRVVVLSPKPRDPATDALAERLQLKKIKQWPPARRFWQEKPRGYVLQPDHIVGDEAANREKLHGVFSDCLNDQYWTGDSVTFADDVYLLAVMYGLNQDLEKLWTAGAGMGSALISANQKPSGTLGGGSVSSFSYNAPTHLFLGKDRDKRNVERFSEIGGIDPKIIQEIVRDLNVYRLNDNAVSEKLYLDKRGPYTCAVGV